MSLCNRDMIAAAASERSWELSVQVDIREGEMESMKFKLRVKGDLHIGGLMLKLVEKISKYSQYTKSYSMCSFSFKKVYLETRINKAILIHIKIIR